MGKAKKNKKFKAPKDRPTGLPSVGEFVAEMGMTEESNTPMSTLQSLVEKLQSPSIECRECACATLANLVAEPGAVQALMKLNIVKILGPLILDPSLDIRHRAVGALRNMSVDGGTVACEKMVESDVMTPILAFIQQFGKGDIFSEVKAKQKDAILETYTHAFYLLLNLCECSGIAVNLVNRENLVPVLCMILTSDKVGIELQLAVGEFLYTISDDNKEFMSQELTESIQTCMSNNKNSSSELALLRTLLSGVLLNFGGSKITMAHGGLVVCLLEAVAEVLSVDITESVQVLSVTTTNGTETAAEKEDAQTSEKNDTAKKIERLKDLRNILQAQEVALEIITNLCCTDDEEWEDLSNSGESSTDEAMDTTDVDMDDQGQASLCVSSELHTEFVRIGIVTKVLQASQPMSETCSKTLLSVTGGADIISKYLRKQIHGLLCLSNLASSLEVEAFGGADRLHGVWQGLAQISVTQNCTESHELLDAVTNAMRAVIQKLTETHPSKFQEVQPTDLQFMVEMATKCEWSEVRVNALRIVSAIGTVLAQSGQVHNLLKDIGLLLLEVSCKDTDVWVKSEALDAIFDVFGEDHLDPIVREISLVEKLKAILPQYKSMIQANRKTLGEHYPVISAARTNLIRFIQYKSKPH